VRSTFIAGFPGETEAEFEHLLGFLREAQIDRAGCFAYSPVEGAAANELPGQVPQAEREARRSALHGRGRAGVGRPSCARASVPTMQVLVDHAPALGRRAVSAAAMPMRRRSTARCACCRPRRPAKTLKVGEFTRARIVATEGHDLVGQPI
jgi:ribosomal protein S12 methylthiotransferase